MVRLVDGQVRRLRRLRQALGAGAAELDDRFLGGEARRAHPAVELLGHLVVVHFRHLAAAVADGEGGHGMRVVVRLGGSAAPEGATPFDTAAAARVVTDALADPDA